MHFGRFGIAQMEALVVVGGRGGTVEVSKNVTLTALNGSVSKDSSEPCKIYLQDGIKLEIGAPLGYWTEQDNKYISECLEIPCNYQSCWVGLTNDFLTTHVTFRERSEDKSICTKYINPETNNSQGIGSGAGYIELSNGTYEVNSSLN